VMTPDLLVVDTEAELITGSGSIDFRNEKYDLHLKADSKKPSPLALKGPIVIGGTFGTPAIHPSLGPVIARIGAAVGLGVVAPPLALLPLIDLGDAPDADCRALYQDARLQTGTSERIARGSKATEKPQRAAEGERLAKSQKEAAASGQPN
jgi:AsmA family protein